MAGFSLSNISSNKLGAAVLSVSALLEGCSPTPGQSFRPNLTEAQVLKDMATCEKVTGTVASRLQGQLNDGKSGKLETVIGAVTGNNPTDKPNTQVFASNRGEARYHDCMNQLAQVDPRTREGSIPAELDRPAVPGAAVPEAGSDGAWTLPSGPGGLSAPNLNDKVMDRFCNGLFVPSAQDAACKPFVQREDAKRANAAAEAASGATR